MTETHSPAARELPTRAMIAAAFDWWREAGVDCAFNDTPNVWLRDDTAAELSPPSAPPPPPQAIGVRSPVERAIDRAGDNQVTGGKASDWPQDLEAFREWWVSPAAFPELAATGRIPSTGPADAPLAIVTPFPVPESDQRLMAAILQAMGLVQQELFLASVLPTPVTLPEWTGLAERGLADLTHHHLGLARPARIIAFDRALAPVFAVPAAHARMPQMLTIAGRPVPLLLGPGLGELVRSPEHRKAFWNRWLDWTS